LDEDAPMKQGSDIIILEAQHQITFFHRHRPFIKKEYSKGKDKQLHIKPPMTGLSSQSLVGVFVSNKAEVSSEQYDSIHIFETKPED
jgi:hypothetical protein